MNTSKSPIPLIPQGNLFQQLFHESPVIIASYLAASLFIGFSISDMIQRPAFAILMLVLTADVYLLTRHRFGSLLAKAGHSHSI